MGMANTVSQVSRRRLVSCQKFMGRSSIRLAPNLAGADDNDDHSQNNEPNLVRIESL